MVVVVVVTMILREEIGILMPPDGRCHHARTRIVELPAVPRSSFGELRNLVSAIAVKTTVTFGTADQLVHVTGLYPEVGLVRAHGRGHVLLEGRRDHPQLLATVFRGDNLQLVNYGVDCSLTYRLISSRIIYDQEYNLRQVRKC